MPAQGRDVSSTSSPSPQNAKRAPIRIQPTGYRRPSQSSAQPSSSNPASPKPKSPQARSGTPKSPTSYNHTPRTPTSPGPSGPASLPVQRPRLSSRARSAPLVAKTHGQGGDFEGQKTASGLGLLGVSSSETSKQPRVEEDVPPNTEEREPGAGDGEEQGSEDEELTRPATAIASGRPKRPSLATSPVSAQPTHSFR